MHAAGHIAIGLSGEIQDVWIESVEVKAEDR